MVDGNSEAGREGAERAARAARSTDTLGPGTAGYTTSGAAYRGNEIAAATGRPHPAEQGFTQIDGLGYVDHDAPVERYSPAQHVEGEIEVPAQDRRQVEFTAGVAGPEGGGNADFEGDRHDRA